MSKADERMMWLLRIMVDPRRCRRGHILAWDEDVVDEFVRAFPEAEKTLVVYMMGSNSSPMLNRAAKRAKTLGYITPGSIGNDGARSFNARTWCRTWRLTASGREFMMKAAPELTNHRLRVVRGELSPDGHCERCGRKNTCEADACEASLEASVGFKHTGYREVVVWGDD